MDDFGSFTRPPGRPNPTTGQIPLPSGRVGSAILMTHTRDLTPADALLLASQPGPAKSNAPVIQKFSATHQQAARLVARGLSNLEVALAVGRTAQRISDLKRDPTFCELVAYNQEMLAELVTDESAEFAGIYKDVARLSL